MFEPTCIHPQIRKIRNALSEVIMQIHLSCQERALEGGSLDAIVALPLDDEAGIVFFDVDGFGVAVAGQPCGELIGQVEQPGVAGFGRQQDKLTNSDDAPNGGQQPGAWM